jgi:hypothetical protein
MRRHTKSNNEDPSLIETDWRQPFYDTFELTAEQQGAVDELETKDDGKANLQIQEAFREAANAVRNGGEIRLRVTDDLDLGRRVLRLEVRKSADEELLGTETDTSFALICCCAHCKCWHLCGTIPNPCPTCV